MEVFKDYACYYNAFYQDKDYAAEAGQVDMLLKKYNLLCHGSPAAKIINFGCGTGKHDIELSKLGYACTGIDRSPLMVEIARKNAEDEGRTVDFSVADIRTYEPEEKFDAVISLFHVMSYQNSNDDVLAAFKAARKALGDNRGGVFLFDVWYGPGVLSDKPSVRVKEVQSENYKLVRIARPIMHDKENVVDVCYEVLVIDKVTGYTKTLNEVHHMRYFFRPEVEFYLQRAGFELIDNMDCRTLGETDYASWTSYFVARAV